MSLYHLKAGEVPGWTVTTVWLQGSQSKFKCLASQTPKTVNCITKRHNIWPVF